MGVSASAASSKSNVIKYALPPLDNLKLVFRTRVRIHADAEFPETTSRDRLVYLIRRPELLLALCE